MLESPAKMPDDVLAWLRERGAREVKKLDNRDLIEKANLLNGPLFAPSLKALADAYAAKSDKIATLEFVSEEDTNVARVLAAECRAIVMVVSILWENGNE
jgi:alpha-beta hydrolase superfamily lysophospholipase